MKTIIVLAMSALFVFSVSAQTKAPATTPAPAAKTVQSDVKHASTTAAPKQKENTSAVSPAPKKVHKSTTKSSKPVVKPTVKADAVK